MNRIYLLTVFIPLMVSCSSTQPKVAVTPTPPKLVEPEANVSIDLNSAIQQKLTGRALLNLPAPAQLTDEQLLDLKNQFKKQAEAKAGKQPAPRAVLRALRALDFKALETASLDTIIRASEVLSATQMKNIMQKITTDETCAPAQLSLAMASQSERDFPEVAAKSKAVELYLKAYTCGAGEVKGRAAYRLALFSIADQDCPRSLQYWPSVLNTSEVKFLFSRAQYWKNFCEDQKVDRKQLALNLYQAYPLSYHAIRELQDENEDIGGVIGSRTTPRALVRTQKDDKLNVLIGQVELAIEKNEFDKARRYLSWVPEETWTNLEPHFLIYVAHLASMTQYGLVTFQSLARALSQNPTLKNLTTMRLFYPKWYFAEIEVEAQKNSLDPYLVMALVRQESAFDRGAVSRVGARGLMQMMPGTARSLKMAMSKKDLLDPTKNLRVGTTFLSHLLRRYEGNLVLALAAYNAGSGAVDRWVVRYQVKNPVLFKDLIPYRETREYVASILRNLYWYQMMENQPKADAVAGAQKVTVLK